MKVTGVNHKPKTQDQDHLIIPLGISNEIEQERPR